MSDLQTFAHLVERGIGGAFAADKLACHILRTLQGPHTLTTALRLYQPTRSNVAKAEKLGPSVEAHTGVGPVRIFTQAGVIYVETPSPVGVTVPGAALLGEGLAVPIGMTSLRAVAGWDAEREPHLLLLGPTGKGKTTAARLIAFQLARQNPVSQVCFLVSTFKPMDWAAFDPLAHTLALVTDADESAAMIEWLIALMYRRTTRRVNTPHLFLFLDDLLNLLSKRPELAEGLADLASLGRGAGIHLIIGTQRTGKRGMGDAAVTGNITARLVFSTASAQDAAQFTGRGGSGAELLGRYAGDALLVTDGAGMQRVAVAYVGDGELGRLPHAPSEPPPWGTVPKKGADPALSGPAGQSGTASSAGSAPFLSGPALSDGEREAVLAIFIETGSKSATCRKVWGYKNDKSWAWLHQVLSSAQGETSP